MFAGLVADAPAAELAIETVSTPRRQTRIKHFGSINGLAPGASGYRKEADRTDACIGGHVSLQALHDLTRGMAAVELQKHIFQVAHALLRRHGDDLFGAERFAHA